MQSLTSNRGAGQGVLAVIAVICIAVATYFIVKQSKSKDDETFAASYYYCPNCRKEFVGTSDQVPPIKCPSCNEMTAAILRKYKCKKCGATFPGYIEKFDPDTKRLIERKQRGEKVSGKIGSMLLSLPDEDDWVDASAQEAYEILENIACPKCGPTEAGVEAVIPKPPKKK